MAVDRCSLDSCKKGTAEVVVISILSALHIAYLVFLQMRRTREHHYLVVRGFVVLYLIARLLSLYVYLIVDSFPGAVYSLFISLMFASLVCAALQWANQVVTVCRANTHLQEHWMEHFLMWTHAGQVSAFVVFPIVHIVLNGGFFFTCNTGSVLFLLTLTAYIFFATVPILLAFRSIRRAVQSQLEEVVNVNCPERFMSFARTLKRVTRIAAGVAALSVGWTVFVFLQVLQDARQATCIEHLPVQLFMDILAAGVVGILLWHTDVVSSADASDKSTKEKSDSFGTKRLSDASTSTNVSSSFPSKIAFGSRANTSSFAGLSRASPVPLPGNGTKPVTLSSPSVSRTAAASRPSILNSPSVSKTWASRPSALTSPSVSTAWPHDQRTAPRIMLA